jgi:DMSO/TMAO reductase YedYZ molybdopterin-dependent catalytic subunit
MTRPFVSNGPGFGLGLVLVLLLGVPSGRDATGSGLIEVEEASLRVGGQVDSPVSLTATDMAALPRTTVEATEHGGARAEFEGVALAEILRHAGAPLGERLRGEAAASYVVVKASDGYQAVFALAELDPAFTDRVVLLADRRDGRPMIGPEGPLRIVVPDEKRHARWVRMVESLTVLRAHPVETPSR